MNKDFQAGCGMSQHRLEPVQTDVHFGPRAQGIKTSACEKVSLGKLTGAAFSIPCLYNVHAVVANAETDGYITFPFS